MSPNWRPIFEEVLIITAEPTECSWWLAPLSVFCATHFGWPFAVFPRLFFWHLILHSRAANRPISLGRCYSTGCWWGQRGQKPRFLHLIAKLHDLSGQTRPSLFRWEPLDGVRCIVPWTGPLGVARCNSFYLLIGNYSAILVLFLKFIFFKFDFMFFHIFAIVSWLKLY